MEQDLSQLAKKIEEIGLDGLASVLRLLDVGGSASQVDPSNFADLTDLAALAGKIGPTGLDRIRSLLDAGVVFTTVGTAVAGVGARGLRRRALARSGVNIAGARARATGADDRDDQRHDELRAHQ